MLFLRVPSSAPNDIHTSLLFSASCSVALMAAFGFSSSPDLQSFIISVILGSPATRCNICVEVLHVCCGRDFAKWKDWEHFHLFSSVVCLATERPGSLWISSALPRFHSGFRNVHTLLQPSQTLNYSYFCCCLISFSLFSLLVLISDLKDCLLSDLVGFRWSLSTVEFESTPRVLKILIINIDCST